MSLKLEDYGFVGDTHTAALIGINGSIDWMCLPRFDSGACFAALLGDEQNGCWRIAPAQPWQKASQAYRKDTLILETEFETEQGAIRLIDCMPPRASCPHVVRVVDGIRGQVAVEMKLVVRFDYGLTIPWVQRDGGQSTMIAGPDALVLRTDAKTRGQGLSTVAEFTINEGERKYFVLSWYPSHEKPPKAIDPERAVNETQSYWADWVSHCSCKGEWRDLMVRSLITLKALTYAPTGGIVAAATTNERTNAKSASRFKIAGSARANNFPEKTNCEPRWSRSRPNGCDTFWSAPIVYPEALEVIKKSTSVRQLAKKIAFPVDLSRLREFA